MLSWPSKDPDEVLDYELDWSKWLDGDTIQTSLFDLAIPAGLNIDNQAKTATTSTIWLSGGTDGQLALVHCRITTTGGRTRDTTVAINIAAR